jgi:diguanylate cyclase (GGDEF)-like protein
VNSYALIAELDPRRAAVYRRSVEAQHLDVVVVRDGAAAVRALRDRGAPVLLVTDLSLPQRDGFSVITELRRISPPENTAVLVFCGFADLRAAAWSLRTSLGIVEVADKNISDQALDRSVARALETVVRQAQASRPGRQAHHLVRRILQRVSETFRVPVVAVSTEYGESRRLMACMNLGTQAADPHPWPILQQVMTSREPLVVADVTAQPVFGVGPVAPSLALRGLVAVPLVTSAGQVIGALSLVDFAPLQLTPGQIDLLGNVASRVADELWSGDKADLVESGQAGNRHSPEDRANLERLALTDCLTGLFNRHAGELALQREVAHARRASFPVSLVLLDLDSLKQINDTYGHSAGDQALRVVARALASVVRASDVAVRWGGDEFLVVLPDASIPGALKFVERVRAEIESQDVRGAGSVTVSAGVAEVKPDEDPADTLKRADIGLYQAKGAGRGRVKSQNGAPPVP